MMPFNRINEMDVFKSSKGGFEYTVIEKDENEKMILLQAYSLYSGENVGKPSWKKNTDPIFSEELKIQDGEHFTIVKTRKI